MHKHNNNSNKGGLDSVTLCRGNRRGGGIWREAGVAEAWLGNMKEMLLQ